jgi:hypothetical protein
MLLYNTTKLSTWADTECGDMLIIHFSVETKFVCIASTNAVSYDHHVYITQALWF